MSQETKSDENFNQRINIIIAVVVAIIAVLGSFITKLENEASTQSNKANIAEQKYYYQAIGKQISGKADINYAFGTVYQLWYQYDVQRLAAQKRNETDLVKTYTELRDAVAKTSPLFDSQYFDPNTGKVNLLLYEADIYRRELYELEERQLAADEVASAWGDKSSQYTLQLTLLAVAGFLLGLALMTQARIPTLVFSISGVLMVVVISVWAYQLSLMPVTEQSSEAITIFAEGASLMDQKLWSKALPLLDEAIEKAGTERPYGRAYLLRAHVHSEMGDFAEAIKDYQVAIASGFTGDPTVDASLVQAYFYMGDFQNAILSGNTAIENSPDNLALRQQVNMAVLANGDINKASEHVAVLLKKATEKVQIQRQLGNNEAAAEVWWLLNDAAYQYNQLATLLNSSNVTSPVKQNIDNPIMIREEAEQLASQLRTGALALKYNIQEENTSTASAKVDIKAINPLTTPDEQYVYKVDLEFLYSGIEVGQLLSIVTYRNGIEEPSWGFSQQWAETSGSGTAHYTLSPSYSSLYIVPPGFYTVYIYLNDDLLAQKEFIVDDSNNPIVPNTDSDMAFDGLLDQFDFYTGDFIYGYSTDDWGYYDWYYYSYDPFFFYGEENNYYYFLESSYNFYTNYCTDSNDLNCFTTNDSDGDGTPDELDACALEPGPLDSNGCPVSTGDADGDGISDASDGCPYEAGLETNNGCAIDDSDLDSDGDGVSDSEDGCLYDAGSVENGGCPVSTDDADGDGISDEFDGCPYDGGLEEDNGCPANDADGDGVLDSEDNCQYDSGSIENGGCPVDDSEADSDGDGISDDTDNCQYDAGPLENGGCPADESESDSDGDGVPDSQDGCRYDAGPAENNGCPVEVSDPDSDGDGVPDSQDGCPSEAGPAGNGGCPVAESDPDSDGDGVPDSQDGCPNEAGPAENGGCPE